MSKKVSPGRPSIRKGKEAEAAIVSLAKFWRTMDRRFTASAIARSVFGYDGGKGTQRLIWDVLDSHAIECVKPAVTHVANPEPKPRSICTHFVVTTDMHV